MSECYLTPHSDALSCRCDNCGQSMRAGELGMIRDIEQRLTPGCIVPVGECLLCGALAYYEDGHAPAGTAQARAFMADSLVAEAWSAFDDEEDSVKEEHAELIDKLQAFAEGR